MTDWPELMDAAHRVRLGWAEGASEGADLSPDAGDCETRKRDPDRSQIPVATAEDIAAGKAEWERKLKRERQRRWRRRKRAGLV